ncbi:hypothetical protein GobsT_72900 [Gemmata obscuriglobus]|uniref:SWIM-type domain-containing protein n=1 Tax=Gemmata obscuriglobus TaxID=114 RepID=A0A2Z3HD35_9BACT|nr:SWIM zinc finger family protein [Gemmata obscuriglobus]AWM41636.1 hypothetical protein C1280_34645 [Gemmata obscuriglobus]QEG32435.1 hypothetical protein GobsT_72900 [Gemmata obscuriglobus]VTS11791.1 zinc swim-type : Uncharacterized protein OS=uncultured bacterium GN=ACD_45C00350G0002 PE=4 SV=1: SWIM [Gemmata obscuriglobus UQM 2246]
MGWYEFKPYVPVAQRRAQAAKEVAKRNKKGPPCSPVNIEGKSIAATFWGKAWCTNLEGYSDFANRLPRGRTYVRNGSVIDLKIEKGRIKALVSGSELYEIRIDIAALPAHTWAALKKQCAGKIGTIVELLQGKLSKAVMETVTDRTRGLFPKPKEIEMSCTCPDYAGMCKHIAATMYGVGNRLDSAPELLFTLRCVDHTELIEQAIPAAPLANPSGPAIAADDLGAIFGIELGGAEAAPPTPPAQKKPTARAAVKKPAAEKKTPAAKRATTKKPAAPKKKSVPKKG